MASLSRPSFKCLATCGAYSFDWFRACVNVKMRSIATPNDIIDMMASTNATPLATHPICAHIAIKSTVHPPSELRLVRQLAGRHSHTGRSVELLQREVDGDGHDHRHRLSIERCRRDDPLLDGLERRRVEQRNRPQHLGVLHMAVRPDRRLDDHDALHARRLRDRRIDRLDILGLRRLLDVAADPHCGRRWRWRRWRRRWSLDQTADDAADRPADHPALDAADGAL